MKKQSLDLIIEKENINLKFEDVILLGDPNKKESYKKFIAWCLG